MISEIYQYVEIQNDDNGDPSTVHMNHSWGSKKLRNGVSQVGYRKLFG
jgi:hypothetical protein